MTSGNGHFTPTERAILNLLSDGLRHHRTDLYKCLPDNLGLPVNLSVHLHNIRRKLRPKGEEIVCEYRSRTTWYRHVRLLHSAYDGYR